jgi:hypothetical protein
MTANRLARPASTWACDEPWLACCVPHHKQPAILAAFWVVIALAEPRC